MDEVTVCVVLATTLAAAVAATHDGRSARKPPSAVFTAPASPWDLVRDNPLYSGLYEQHLRCSYQTFDVLYERIKVHWCELHELPGPSSVHDIRTRVAVTLCYLANEGTYRSAGSLLGVSKTRCIEYVDEVTNVLNECFLHRDVHLPSSPEEWNRVATDFERVCGIPNAVGAIDGSLFPVLRFADFEGWYCRKGFSAFNLQVVVDCRKHIMSYSLRSGSQNDQSVFNNSSFGQTCQKLMPKGTHLLADAGYRLLPHVMTPYKIYYGMPKDEARFNYYHSKMRIVAECALGLFKGRFRLFKNPLRHHCPNKMPSLISASIVVHNWLIELGDQSVQDEQEPWMHIGDNAPSFATEDDEFAGIDRRNFIKEYIKTL